MPVQLIIPPAQEPLTIAEAKSQLRLDTALDDAQLTGYLLAARLYVENICWRGLVTQTWELVEPHFPTDLCGCGVALPYPYLFPYDSTPKRLHEQAQGVELPMGNLVSVVSVKYVDPTGVQQTLTENTDFVVDNVSLPGRVRLAYGKSWPSHRDQWDAVRIQYVVGWDVASVPQPLKQAMLLLTAEMYETRVPSATKYVASIDFAVDAMLRPYRLVRHT